MSPVVPGWSVVSGSRIGSVHVRDELPLQDAVLTWNEGAQAVVAVADGHGHKAHFRSDTGSALAAVSAVEELRRILPELTDPETAGDLVTAAAAAIVDTWVAKVEHHIEANPYSPDDETGQAALADPLRPYGTTLLAAAVNDGLMVFLQIGDGDSVVVSSRGEAFRAVPDDPGLDGVHTPSLCQREPLRSLRTSVVDARVDDVVLAFLCTDGFGTSRVDADGWWRQTGEQLVDYGRSRGLAWIEAQLPAWLEEPARIGGDDTSMAIIARSDLAGDEPAHPLDTAADDTVERIDTVAADEPDDGVGPVQPRRQY